MSIRHFLWACLLGLTLGTVRGADRPNILWISAEDMGPMLGCFGDPHAITPNLDDLAGQGVRFTHAFTTAGVCAPCRSGIITGMYQTTLGTHHMRCRAVLPSHVRPFPAYLRESGYYCSNNSKQDYQFETPPGVWDESGSQAHWRRRPDPDQPFFSVFNFTGCHESGIANASKYRSVTASLSPEERQDPDRLSTFPPYYPDTPAAREDWKRAYELATAMDAWAGRILAELKEDGLYEDTVVFFWTDHGVGLPRAKRWLYDSGTRIPLIVRIPERWRTGGQGRPGEASDRLVSSLDLGPSVLRLAGVEAPGHMQGRPFVGPGLPEARKHVFGARDRMDERYDIIRMARDRRFKYIRNYEPLKPWYQFVNYSEKGGAMRELRRLHLEGALPEAAGRYFHAPKPVEELYDTQEDPHEIRNLAGDPAYASKLRELRRAHQEWARETRDIGLIPEPLIVQEERRHGSRYAILEAREGTGYMERLRALAEAASRGEGDPARLLEAARDPEPAFRYWAATGVGNWQGGPGPRAARAMRRLLADPQAVVRTAAARALCRMGRPEEALPVLVRTLEEGAQWERLHAAVVLDEIGEQALPVKEAMRKALEPRQDLFSSGKYVVRVINRALNQLEGTGNQVP